MGPLGRIYINIHTLLINETQPCKPPCDDRAPINKFLNSAGKSENGVQKNHLSHPIASDILDITPMIVVRVYLGVSCPQTATDIPEPSQSIFFCESFALFPWLRVFETSHRSAFKRAYGLTFELR